MNDNSIENDLDKVDFLLSNIKSARKELIELTNHAEEEVRFRAIESLGACSKASIEHVVEKKLNDSDDLVKTTCLEIISSWGIYQNTDKIITLLEDESMIVRTAAAIALVNIDCQESKSDLIAALGRTDDETDAILHYALYMLGEKSYFDKLLNFLRHDFYRIRCAIANLLTNSTDISDKKIILKELIYQLKLENSKAAKEAITRAITSIQEQLKENSATDR